ncbi:MAG: IS4 family transposase [Planctomycetaceae bacterium]
MSRIPSSLNPRRTDFQCVVAAFLAQPGLPFASVLSAERIERIFARHGNLFGIGQIYSTAVMVWAFVCQVLQDGKSASCQAAVARVAAHQQQIGGPVPTADTGDYCRARAKLSEAALHDLSVEIADELEDGADAAWLWKGLHAKLIDGFTFTMPDTARNQAVYPSPKTQKKGVGLPIARATIVLSLATAAALELAAGPYSGKQTGETALLRDLLDSFHEGDLAVMDRYYCSFMMIALLLSRGVQVCARMHHKRRVDFRRGRRLGQYDHIIVWTRPARPQWMDEDTYATIPETLELREIRFNIEEPGFRTRTITIATTLTNADVCSKADIAELYPERGKVRYSGSRRKRC